MAQVRERRLEVKDYADGVRAGDRAMLGRAITLIESAKPEHARMAQALLQELLPETGKAHRVGITGVPGVGKSTMIDRLGLNLVEQGHRVAVLAVDPTSTRSGGSILGDKTRMADLAQRREAYIRPSPTSGTLGGVARRTREAMALVEAAGFDVVIVETVGVGQSEVTVAGMVDFFLVLLLAGGGDDLQGIKRGIVEIADMIAITKADGDNIARARRAQAVYQGALVDIDADLAQLVDPGADGVVGREPGARCAVGEGRRAPGAADGERGIGRAAREPGRGVDGGAAARAAACGAGGRRRRGAAAGRARGRGAGRQAHAGPCGRRAVGDDGAWARPGRRPGADRAPGTSP